MGRSIPSGLEIGDSSDLNGLLISYGKTYSEKWAVIQSSGFLTGFALAQETLEGAYVFEARLTPLSAVKRLETDEEASLGSGDLRDPDLEVTFSGTYDGSAFSISDLQYNCYAEIIQYIYNEGEEDKKCMTQFEASIPVHNYSSYLAHGFYGSSPITLQEILESAPGTAGGMEVIRGSGKFGNPSPDVGSYPFNTSSVIWNIVHVQDQGIK